MNNSRIIPAILLMVLAASSFVQAQKPNSDPDRWSGVQAWVGTFSATKKISLPERGYTFNGEVDGSVRFDEPPTTNRSRIRWTGSTEGSVRIDGTWEVPGLGMVSQRGAGMAEGTGRLVINLNQGMYFVNFGGTEIDVVEETNSKFGSGRQQNKGSFHATALSTSDQLPASGLVLSGVKEVSGSPLDPHVYLVRWELRPAGQEPEVEVAIQAPPCVCLDADDPAGERTRVIATASVPGGEFTPFTLEPEGQSPEVLYNQGGSSPELMLVGVKDTGAVTIGITYLKDGKSHEATPVRIEFCALKPILLQEDEQDWTFAMDQTLELKAESDGWHNGAQLQERQFHWEMDEIGISEKITDPADAIGKIVTFGFDGLPEANSDFGPKNIVVKTDVGACQCDLTREVRVFFPPTDKNHPGVGSGRTPNWLYYWLQTNAGQAFAPGYAAVLTSDSGKATGQCLVGQYNYARDRVMLSDCVLTAVCFNRPDGTLARKIDCFAETLRHEKHHQTERWEWWGAVNPQDLSIAEKLFALDRDGDLVPNEIEQKLESSRGCSWKESSSCRGRPRPYMWDMEMNAYQVGWEWALCGAKAEDWSHEGQQWRGNECPR